MSTLEMYKQEVVDFANDVEKLDRMVRKTARLWGIKYETSIEISELETEY